MEKLEYNPALDGLRAIAVLAVMLFHAQVPGFSGGFLGVDVFFVLSGYLITRIIYEKKKNGSFSFSSFYKSRAIRIIPPLLAAATFTGAIAISMGQSIEDTRIIPALLFYANIDISNHYSQSIFNHSWSLSLEEQFYLFWPVALFFIVRYTRKPEAWVLGLYLISSLWRAYMVFLGYGWTEIYYAPDTRLSGLLLGASLGLGYYRIKLPPFSSALAVIVLVVCFYYSEWRQSFVFYTLLTATELSTAVLVINFTTSGGAIKDIFSKQPLVKIGILSYSMYLFHYPMMWVMRGEGSPISIFFFVTAMTIALSETVRLIIERPIRNLYRGQPPVSTGSAE